MTYASAFAALADPTRRDVLERLRQGPRAVGDIARGMPVSRPAVSQHLKVLKEAGLVTDRSEGTRRVYYLDPNGLAALRAWLDRFWDEALTAFQAEAEKDSKGEEPE
jgi:DNA-binding transcriptional ArsR family regulator